MNFRTLLKSVLMTAVLMGLMSIATFAQVYVSNTNGDDFVGQGTQLSPYKTITKALGVVASGGTISIAADTYNEGSAILEITKPVTLVSTTFNGLSTVTLPYGLKINTGNASDVVKLGRAADNSQSFKLSSTVGLGNVALLLTKGNLQISTSLVTVDDGKIIRRVEGTLDNPATVSNVNVEYTGSSTVTAGGETPADLGSGALTVNLGDGAKTVTFNNSITTTGGITVTVGNVVFGSNLALSSSNLSMGANSGNVTVAGNVTFSTGKLVNNNTTADPNQKTLTVNGNVTWTINSSAATLPAHAVIYMPGTATGNIVLNGTVNFTKAVPSTGAVAANPQMFITNAGAGTLKLTQGYTVTSGTISSTSYAPVLDVTNSSTGTLWFGGAATIANLTNGSTGTVKLTGGSVSGSVTNDNAGTIEILANTTFSGTPISNNAAGSKIKLNSYTLTISKSTFSFTNVGKIYSTTVGEAGTGILSFTNSGTLAGTSIELPNISISSGKTITGFAATNIWGNVTNAGTISSLNAANVSGYFTNSGTVTLGGNIVLAGNYTQSGSGKLTFNGKVFEVKGNWVRTSNDPADVVASAAGSKLYFTGGNAQTFTPGASLTLLDVEINKTAGTVVTLNQSLAVAGDLTITAGKLNLGDYNVRMQGLNKTFTNNGDFYTTTGNGYIIFESGSTALAPSTITGSGVFSNMDIRANGSGTATNVVAGSNIAFSGNLILRKGALDLAGFNFQYKNDVVAIPSVTRTNEGSMSNGGTIDCEAGVVYDIKYIGDDDITATAEELIAGGINNLTIDTGDKNADLDVATTRTVTIPNSITIVGALDVKVGQTLALGGFTLTLDGDGKTHSVVGAVTGGTVDITANNVTINGTTVEHASAYAQLPDVTVNTIAGETFTSSNLKVIKSLEVVDGSTTINMNSKTAEVTTNVKLDAGSLNLNMNSVTSKHDGNIQVEAGSMTYTRKVAETALGANQKVTGTVTLNGGTFTLGSNVDVTDVTTIKDGNLVLGAYTYAQKGKAATTTFDRTGTGTVTGTGKVLFFGAAANKLSTASAFTLPNVEVDNAGGTTFAKAVTVSGKVTLTDGAFALTEPLTLSGNALDYKATADAITGEIKVTGTPTFTLYQDMSVPTLTLNSEGTLTVATDDNTTPTARTLTVSTAFTQTAGNVATGINNLVVTGDYTRTAGTISHSSGLFELNTAGAVDLGSDFAVDNMKVSQTVDFGAKKLTVNKYLTMADGTLETDADDQITFAKGVTIERQSATALLEKKPVFGADINVFYSTAGVVVTTDKELPAVVNNLTVDMGAGGSVKLNANVKVNGTLSLSEAIDATTVADVAITMADNSTLELMADGDVVLDEALTRLGKLNIVYNGAANTTDMELGPNTNATTHTAGNVTFKSNVKLDDPATFTGTVTFDGGDLDLNGQNLFLQGDVVEKTDAGATGTFAPTAASNLYFSGAAAQTVTFKSSKEVDPQLNVIINKTNNTDKVTLVGGGLDFAKNSMTLALTKGLLVTGDNVVVLKQSAASGQPVQGFTRTSGAVVGNVKKFIDKTATEAISRVEYPTGTANGEYRPLAMYFKTAPQSSINLTVNHSNTKAGGNNGFPITAGTKQITNYPDFFWYVKSDIALAPSYKYDMDAMAEGYTDYTKDQIQNVRFVRRDSGSVSNQWVMQGADNSYDNSTVSLTKPVVKVIDAQSGITSQGSIFSYSQSNKAPLFTAALVNATVSEGDTVKGTYTSNDPDFNQTVTLSAVTLPTGASFDAATGKLNWVVGYDVATKANPSVAKTITIRSTDNMGAYRDTTVTVTVNNKNRLPVVVAMGAKNVAENIAFEYQYAATDADGEAVTYTMNVTGDATLDSAKISAAGKLTWTPGFGNAGKKAILNVNVTDGIGTTTVVDTITVTKTNRAPQFTVKVDTATIPMGSLYNATFTATDLDANTITYSVTGDDTTATINASTGVFSWTPAYKVAGGVYNFTVKATDNGSPALSVTTPLKLTVTLVNAAPVFTATLPTDTIAVGDTLKFKYVATDANGDALTYALVNAPLGATIDAATGNFTWIPQASQTAIYVIKATVTDGKISTPVVTSKEVLVKVVTVAVSGKVTYYNSTKGVPGVEVTLTPTTGTALKATTDASGNYTVSNVNAGAYTVKAAKTGGWGGVTAGDALLAALNGVDATANPLTDVQKLAADVSGNSVINATDAGLIVQKYVDNTTTFAVADWLFKTEGTINVGTKAVTSNITAIAAGDVNGSLANGTIAKNAPSVSTSEEQKIAPKASFTLPIKVAEDAKIGAASIQFTYPADLVKFEGVIGADGMVSKDVNGTVTIAWFNTKGMNLKAGEVLAGLKFTATEKFAKGQSFTVTVDNSSEITDVKGQPVSLALSVANVTVAVPQAFALNQNYPNPFNPTTTISYDLPVDGKVTLSIYNSIGELVTTLVNSVQTAGSYKYNWNAASMSSGVYLYRITVEGQKAYSSTQKMVLMK